MERFITQDTYEGEINNPLSLNSYTYVKNNPSRYTDPSGHCIPGEDGCEYSNDGGTSQSSNYVYSKPLRDMTTEETARLIMSGAVHPDDEYKVYLYMFSTIVSPDRGGTFKKLVSVLNTFKETNVITYAFKSPNQRHYATKVTQKTLTKESNTVIEPWVDVVTDVSAINAGKAVRNGETFTINGRSYGYYDNVLYPVSGNGFHLLDRGAFKALGVYNTFGNTEKAAQILDNMKMTQEAKDAALKVWEVLPK